MFYDYETNQIPVNIAFVTPSVTTFTGLNPSFRFYKLDGPYEGASMVILLIIYQDIAHNQMSNYHEFELCIVILK